MSIFSSQASAVQLQLESVVYWDAATAADDLSYTGHVRDVSASTATWSFDGATLTSDGVFSSAVVVSLTPFWFILDEVIEDLSIGVDGVASATSYTCVEGNFFVIVGENVSVCGQYEFGANGIDESNITYSGTTFTRTIGGDDTPSESNDGVLYDPLQLIAWYGFEIDSWDGETLLMSQTASNGSGKIMTFSAVPVPAAAWLFGSALIGLAGMKRRK